MRQKFDYFRKHNFSNLMTGASNMMDSTKASKNEMTALPRNAVNCVAEENENDERVSGYYSSKRISLPPCRALNALEPRTENS